MKKLIQTLSFAALMAVSLQLTGCAAQKPRDVAELYVRALIVNDTETLGKLTTPAYYNEAVKMASLIQEAATSAGIDTQLKSQHRLRVDDAEINTYRDEATVEIDLPRDLVSALFQYERTHHPNTIQPFDDDQYEKYETLTVHLSKENKEWKVDGDQDFFFRNFFDD